MYANNKGHRLYKNHLVSVSTGNDYLDNTHQEYTTRFYINVPYIIGSVVLIITDGPMSEYYLQLLRLSAAEAIVNEQQVVIFDQFAQRGTDFWKKLLPKVTKRTSRIKPTTTNPSDNNKEESKKASKTMTTTDIKFGDVLKSMQGENEDKDLILAWRYNESIQTQTDLKQKQLKGVHKLSDFQNRYEYQFDLSHEMTDNISGLNIPINKDKYFRVVESDDSLEDFGCSQLLDINTYADKYLEILESPEDQSFFRFIVPDFMNLEMLDNQSKKNFKPSKIIKFLKSLRTLVRTMNAVFTLTIDRSNFESDKLLNYFLKYSDQVISMKSFADSPDKFLDYQGTIQLLKQPTLNGLI